MPGIKIPKAQIYPTFSLANIKKQFQPRNIVSAMASDGFLPVIALEAFVEAGRTYQAYKRGGFDEARERITEEFSGAVFWLGGVTALNWLFEKMGQKLLSLPKINVDIDHDNTRNPLKKYLAKEVKTNGTGAISEKLMAKFKFTKVIASVLVANAFIGFILPKINQAITRSYHKNDKKQNNEINNSTQKPNMDEFLNGNEKGKNTSFTGKWNLLSIANNFESKRNWKLLSVDVGTASGRAYSARNNDERIEILFRDLSSVFFYMFNMGLVNSLFNRIEQGWKNNNTTRLDPVCAKFATEYMQNYVGDKKIDLKTFEKEVLGENKDLPDSIKEKFNGKNIITLDDFKTELKNVVPEEKLKEIETLAEKMSELQPKRMINITENGTTKLAEKSILTIEQAKDVLNGGHINNPEFLKEFYTNTFGEKFLAKGKNKYKFIPQSEINTYKKDLTNYIKSIIEQAKKADAKEITTQILKKALKNNFKMNAINWGSGFAISALFLSTLIPKMQYLITKLRTGKDSFPGTEEYRQDK